MEWESFEFEYNSMIGGKFKEVILKSFKAPITW